jgi:hypothetical protein
MRRLWAAALVIAFALAGPGVSARACLDCGAPPGPVIGGAGTIGPAGGDHFVTVVERNTTLLDIDPSGTVNRWTTLAGSWGVPLVAADGTTGGVSGDGRRLVLEHASYIYPKRVTRFLVLNATTLRVRDRVTLRGDYSFDAISPDGSLMFLIEHPIPGGLANYLVRAYDLQRDRMLRRVIREEGEPSAVMNGIALTRATTADGAWAYTLYDEGRGRMFVHALDTVRGRAHCIDLPRAAGGGVMQLDLSADWSRLDVLVDGEGLARINTATFAISQPPAPAAVAAVFPPVNHSAPAVSGSGRVKWLLAAAAALAVAGIATLVARRRGATLLAWRPRSD